MPMPASLERLAATFKGGSTQNDQFVMFKIVPTTYDDTVVLMLHC